MAQGELAAGLGQHVDVVRQARFVDLSQPAGNTDQQTEAQARQPHLGDGAQHQQIVITSQTIQEGGVGEGCIGLVHHHQAGGDIQDRLEIGCTEQVAGRVVGIGKKDHRRLVRFNGHPHGIHVELELAVQRHPHVVHAHQGGDHAVHDKAGLRRQYHAARLRHGQCDHLDQLVGTVAEQNLHVRRYLHAGAQTLPELACARIGIAVEADFPQGVQPGLDHRLWPGIGIFHGIQLDAVTGIRDMIGR